MLRKSAEADSCKKPCSSEQPRAPPKQICGNESQNNENNLARHDNERCSHMTRTDDVTDASEDRPEWSAIIVRQMRAAIDDSSSSQDVSPLEEVHHGTTSKDKKPPTSSCLPKRPRSTQELVGGLGDRPAEEGRSSSSLRPTQRSGEIAVSKSTPIATEDQHPTDLTVVELIAALTDLSKNSGAGVDRRKTGFDNTGFDKRLGRLCNAVTNLCPRNRALVTATLDAVERGSSEPAMCSAPVGSAESCPAPGGRSTGENRPPPPTTAWSKTPSQVQNTGKPNHTCKPKHHTKPKDGKPKDHTGKPKDNSTGKPKDNFTGKSKKTMTTVFFDLPVKLSEATTTSAVACGDGSNIASTRYGGGFSAEMETTTTLEQQHEEGSPSSMRRFFYYLGNTVGGSFQQRSKAEEDGDDTPHVILGIKVGEGLEALSNVLAIVRRILERLVRSSSLTGVWSSYNIKIHSSVNGGYVP